MQQLVNHLKQFGFVFQGSEIYGGLANTWDYGPLGVAVIRKIKAAWWQQFVQNVPNVFGLDSKILMNPQIWKASGHVEHFSDPLIENKTNGKRYRADQVIATFDPTINAEAWTKAALHAFIVKNITTFENVVADWSTIREFHLMFETNQGVIVNQKSLVYLRPETAQGIFVNFKNVQRTQRAKVPFGIAQVGKSFRNEVTPGNFIFRTREFEQMELEYFVTPKAEQAAYEEYLQKSFQFIKTLGISARKLRLSAHDADQLAHYSTATSDVEYQFSFGWGEIAGIAIRTDFDLKTHMQHAKQDLRYLDPETNEKYLPYVIEPSFGVDRLFLAVLDDAYQTETLSNEATRIVLKIAPNLAPYKVAVLPLQKKLEPESRKILAKLIAANIDTTYDQAGSIGKRYRRQDAIGTPFCLTVDFDTLVDQKVTIRDRDTMQQVRIAITQLSDYFAK